MTGIKAINKSRKSRKIYGGLNNNDFLLIKEMKDRNKLIIMEYNSFDYPTAQFESVKSSGKTWNYLFRLDRKIFQFT